MGYLRPVSARVSCSYDCHLNRTPPSSMPGTDYACGFGTEVLCGDDGWVTRVVTSTGSASGRQVYVRFTDGREAAYIHLSRTIYVSAGDRVSRGSVLALSGASGFGKENGYAAHLHVTLWVGVAWNSRTLDFDKFVGAESGAGGGGVSPFPPPSSDDALLRRREEDGMFIKAASYADVYKVDSVWNEVYPLGQARMRVCGASEAAFATTGKLVIEGYDSVLSAMAADAGYGLPMPTAPRDDLEVIMIQDGGAITYALWGPGFWDDTEGLDPAVEAQVANGWASIYGNAKNLTYAEWDRRKAIGTGGS